MASPFKLNLLITLALLVVTGPRPATALPQPTASPDFDTQLFTDFSYFNTEANYDVGGGSFTNLGNGRYYRLMEFRFGASHWFMPDLNVIMDLGVGRAESHDGGFTRTKTGLTDVTAGFRYVLSRSKIIAIPELLFVFPFNRVDPDADDVLTGEGAMKINGGLWAEIWFGSLSPFAQVSFLYQDEGRAAHALYLIGAAYEPGAWRISGEFYGSTVIIDDENVDARFERDNVVTRVNGGSWKFYGVNPSNMGLRVNSAFSITDGWRAGLTFDHTVNGEAAAAGWTAMARLEFGFDVRQEPVMTDVNRPRALEPEKKMLQKFEPEQPAYDPTLFDEPKPKPKRKRPSRVKPKVKPEDLDKSLQDVQKTLEQ